MRRHQARIAAAVKLLRPCRMNYLTTQDLGGSTVYGSAVQPKKSNYYVPLPQLVNRVAGVPEHLMIKFCERVADVPVDGRIARL
jgi:hypothetical protein